MLLSVKVKICKCKTFKNLSSIEISKKSSPLFWTQTERGGVALPEQGRVPSSVPPSRWDSQALPCSPGPTAAALAGLLAALAALPSVLPEATPCACVPPSRGGSASRGNQPRRCSYAVWEQGGERPCR